MLSSQTNKLPWRFYVSDSISLQILPQNILSHNCQQNQIKFKKYLWKTINLMMLELIHFIQFMKVTRQSFLLIYCKKSNILNKKNQTERFGFTQSPTLISKDSRNSLKLNINAVLFWTWEFVKEDSIQERLNKIFSDLWSLLIKLV